MPASSKRKGGSYVEAMDAMAEDMMPKPIEEEEGSEEGGSETPDALIAGIESRLSKLRALLPGGGEMDEEEEEEMMS